MNNGFAIGSGCGVHSSTIASANRINNERTSGETIMFNRFKTMALSVLIGLGAVTATVPAFAQEGGVYFEFGQRDGFGIYTGDGYRRDYDRRYYRDRAYRRCTPERALFKAERMGIRRARVADVDRRTITIRGRSHGDRVFVTFARAPHCPVIG
jgi:hypothetical protein